MSNMSNALQAYEELEAMWEIYEEDWNMETEVNKAFYRYAITEHTAHIKKQLGLTDVAFAEGAIIYAGFREEDGEMTLQRAAELADPLFNYYAQPWEAAKKSHEVAA